MVTMAFLLKLIAIILLLVALFAFYQSWKAKKSASNEGARQRNDPLAFAAGVSGENDFTPQVIGPGAILSYAIGSVIAANHAACAGGRPRGGRA